MTTATALPYALFPTAVGSCAVSWSDRGLTRLQLPEENDEATALRLAAGEPASPEKPPAFVREAIARISRLLAGEKDDLASIPLDLDEVPSFPRRVYEE